MACESGLTLSLIVGLVLLLILAGRPMVEAQKVRGAMDIVVVLNVGASSHPTQWPDRDHETNALKEAYAEFFPQNFGRKDGATRLGVVQLTETENWSIRLQEKIVLNLTNDMNDFKKEVKQWKPNVWNRGTPAYWANIHQALIAIQNIADTNDTTRAKIVVMVMNKVHYPWYWNGGLQLLEKLHADGVLFYVVVVGTSDRVDITQIKNESEVIASDKKRVIVRDETAMTKHDLLLALDEVKKVIIDDLCGPGVCVFFQKNSSCSNLVLTGFGVNCGAFGRRKNCTSNDDCRRDCDEYWPWELNNCNHVQCGATLKRQGNEPHKGNNKTKSYMLTNCPKIKLCPCSSTSPSPSTLTSKPSSSTSSPTSTSITSPTTTTTSSSTSSPSTHRSTTSSSTTTSRKTTSSIKPVSPSRSSTSSRTTGEQTTHGQSTEPSSSPRPTTRPPRKPSTGASTTVIYTVVGLIVVLVIVIIVIGSVVSMKKRKRKGTSIHIRTKKMVASEKSRSDKLKDAVLSGSRK